MKFAVPIMMAALAAPEETAESPAQGRTFPPVEVELANGSLDWSALRLEVHSRSDRTVGAWKDRRVQEQDALDSIAPGISTQALRVHLTPDTTAGDLIDAGGELGTRLNEGLRGWRIAETRYHSGGGVEMEAELDLQAWLAPALASLAMGEVTRLPDDAPTGLLIDARGLSFEPSIAPVVLRADGQAVVRAQFLAEDTVRLSTPVLYVTDPADPRAISRAGTNPVLGRATNVRGGALVLEAGSSVGAGPHASSLVAAGRVVVVVDS